VKFIRTENGKQPVLKLKPQLTSIQEKLERINATLNTLVLNKKLVACFLSIAADFHFTKKHSAAMTVSQFELYQQALAVYDTSTIQAQCSKLYNEHIKLLGPQKAKIKQEPIFIKYPTDTQLGLLANFKQFFEEHLMQIEVLHESSQEYVEELLEYWARKVSEHRLIPEKEATALIESVQRAAEHFIPLIT